MAIGSRQSLRNGAMQKLRQLINRSQSKCGIGWDDEHIFAVQNAQAAEAAQRRLGCMAARGSKCMKERLIGRY